jgi:hypothetical protein
VNPDLRGHALGGEQRGVGAAHEVARRHARFADRYADRNARAVAAVLNAHGVLHAMREAMPGIGADAGQDRGELVSAQAIHGGTRLGRAQRRRDGTDALVADRVTESLVRLLEPVQVEHH